MRFNKDFLPYFIIIGVVFIMLSLAVFYYFFRPSPPSRNPLSSPKPKVSVISPSPSPSVIVDTNNLQYHPDSSTKVQTIDEASQEMLEKDSVIGKLISKLPYQEEYFDLSYSYDDNSFIAALQTSNLDAANDAFDQFLRQNNIKDRNWLYNLKIVNK